MNSLIKLTTIAAVAIALTACGGGGGGGSVSAPTAISAEEAARIEAARLAAQQAAAALAAQQEAARVEAARLAAEAAEVARLARVESDRVAAAQEAARVEAARLAAEAAAAAAALAAQQAAEAAAALAAQQEAARLAAEVARLAAEEAARVEAVRVEAERVEAARVEAIRVEAARVEAVRVEAERVEAARVEAIRVEAERVELARLAVIEAARLLEAARVESLGATADLAALQTRLGSHVTLGTPDADRPTALTATGLNQDVRDAQVAGWTGKDVKIVIAGSDASVSEIISKNTTNNYADIAINNSASFTTDNNVKVVNGSFGQSSAPVTLNIARIPFATDTPFLVHLKSPSDGTFIYAMKDLTLASATNPAADIAKINAMGAAFSNAVIVKSGGDNAAHDADLGRKTRAVDGSDTSTGSGFAVATDTSSAASNSAVTIRYTGELVTKAALDSNFANRVIAVGALKNDGTISDSSNTPGSNANYQAKWVMANGTCPVATCAADTNSTAYAAATVSSYAAIINHKFQGLTAQNTVKIILDTANRDFAGYNPALHGQGEASLSRALAPSGKLR